VRRGGKVMVMEQESAELVEDKLAMEERERIR
jgi:hypothetical protein